MVSRKNCELFFLVCFRAIQKRRIRKAEVIWSYITYLSRMVTIYDEEAESEFAAIVPLIDLFAHNSSSNCAWQQATG